MKKIIAIFAALVGAATMTMNTSAMVLVNDKVNEVVSIEERDVTTYGVGRLAMVVHIYQTWYSERDFVCITQVNETEERLEVEIYVDGSYLSVYAY